MASVNKDIFWPQVWWFANAVPSDNHKRITPRVIETSLTTSMYHFISRSTLSTKHRGSDENFHRHIASLLLFAVDRQFHSR